MLLKVLATGSKGNCYILDSEKGYSAILDAGIPFRQIMQGINYSSNMVDFVLITHEHMDHFKAVPDLLKVGISVFASRGTMNAHGSRCKECRHNETIDLRSALSPGVGKWIIHPFAVEHDCKEPLGFLIGNTSTGHKILYATDTKHIKYRFNNLTHIIIECNYNADILLNNIAAGKVPNSMKKRLMNSHMSLDSCLKFLKSIDLSSCRKIVLIHLSDGNSNARVMVDEITKATGIETIAAENNMIIDFNLYEF